VSGLYVGDRVVVHAQWSSFHGMRGVVTQVRPVLMVLIDDDTYSIAFGEREVRLAELVVHVGGAE
jgi:hypothetical protein